MSIIRIKDLTLRTYIGFKPHERKHKQDVTINLEAEVDTSGVEVSDDIESAEFYDYRALSKTVIKLVEESRFDLLEALTHKVLDTVMQDQRVLRATVEIEKPHALRYSRAVSVELSARKNTDE